jgi:hypothetical protein
MAKLRVLGENPPPPRGHIEDQFRDMRDYLTRLKDEIEFLMLHIGADNLDSDLTERVRNIGDLQKQADETTAAVEDLSAKNKVFRLLAGQTLTITTPAESIYSMLVCCAGPAPLNGLYYLSGYSNSGTHKQYSTILASGSIAVTAAASGFTIKNNHGSYGMRVGIIVAAEDPAGALKYEVTA